MNEYEQQANNFFESTDCELRFERGNKLPHWANDDPTYVYGAKEPIYHGRHWIVTMIRTHKRNGCEYQQNYTFDYWESIDSMVKACGRLVKGRHLPHGYSYEVTQWNPNSIKNPPTAHDILSCLDATCPLDFDEWCLQFGYETNNRKAYASWEACLKQRAALERMFNSEELEQLGNTQ
jgi:hypothetical protein